jgi:predicted amidophosphoribosyltransferase
MISFGTLRDFLLTTLLPRPARDQWLVTPRAQELLTRCVDTTPWAHRMVLCLSPLSYSHTYTEHAVHAMKYRGSMHAVQVLGTLLAPFVAEELGERRLFGTYHETLCIPIPLHTSRLRERGFNQQSA